MSMLIVRGVFADGSNVEGWRCNRRLRMNIPQANRSSGNRECEHQDISIVLHAPPLHAVAPNSPWAFGSGNCGPKAPGSSGLEQRPSSRHNRELAGFHLVLNKAPFSPFGVAAGFSLRLKAIKSMEWYACESKSVPFRKSMGFSPGSFSQAPTPDFFSVL